jgi:hypothetical protein
MLPVETAHTGPDGSDDAVQDAVETNGFGVGWVSCRSTWPPALPIGARRGHDDDVVGDAGSAVS